MSPSYPVGEKEREAVSVILEGSKSQREICHEEIAVAFLVLFIGGRVVQGGAAGGGFIDGEEEGIEEILVFELGSV